MMFADFLKAAIPDRVTCLGVRLRPLSLGSLLLMFRFRNAFALQHGHPGSDPQKIPLGDLLQGIIACSLEYETAKATLEDPHLVRDMKLWARKLRGGFWRQRFHAETQTESFEKRIRHAKAVFAAYFAAGSQYPCTKAECGPDRVIGSAWPMLTLTSCLDDLNLELNTALNQPLAFSRWLVATNAERKGQLEIVERGEVADLQAEADAIAEEIFGKSEPPKGTT